MQIGSQCIHFRQFFDRLVADLIQRSCCDLGFSADLLPCVTLEVGESNDLGLPRFQERHIVLQTVDLLLQRYKAADQIMCQCGIRLIRRTLEVHGDVTPKASHIFSSDANEGVIDFLYHDEMVDCGRPERHGTVRR